MRESRKHLDPATLSKIGRLELRARQVVEGYLAGLHRSPYRGRSVDFAEHRPYNPGDELKHIDWKLWARSDRYFVKLYEEETNVRAYFLMDASGSMGLRSGAMSKYDYGATLAASLAYLLLLQQDAVGLTLFGADVLSELPPSTIPAALDTFCRLMEQVTPAGRTDLGGLLHRIAAQLPKRGLVILVSDLLAPPEDLYSALHRFRYDGHAVILVHVIDPAEEEFPFDGNTLFEGIESPAVLQTDARQVRDAYLEAFGRFRRDVEETCARLGVDYLAAGSAAPLDATLSRFLMSRSGGY